ncbi:MAG: glycosyltransferase family 2 protein [Nitriliruptoraceae bacterium]|nr:glycosyltransferase family 2 protein [Nitriliruptoraceae bacterium]
MTTVADPVAIVIVTHQTRDEVLGCLASLTDEAITTIVVADAGSTDGTDDAVRALATDDPRLRHLPLVNAGFGRAANAGMRATSEPIVLVLNADVRLAPGTIGGLRAALATEPDLGAVGPLVRYPSGRIQASARAIPDLRTAVGHALLGRLRPDNAATRRYHALPCDPVAARPASDPGPAVREVGWLSGCALALRRAAVEQVGGFDPGYFLYVEDLDLARRLRAAGWRIAQAPGCTVVHAVGASTRSVRGRALVAHARSLERYLLQGRSPGVQAALWLPVRSALVGWVVLTWVGERLTRRRGCDRSSTGERR